MPPKKKTKKVTVDEIYKLFTELSEAYDIHGDRQRCGSFLLTAETIRNLKSITCGADIAKLKGCGKSSVEIVDEYIETGKCQRLEELLADESNMDFDEILEKREQERTKVLRAMSKPTTKRMAKAFCMIEHDYMEQRKKEAKQLINEMDLPMRVLVAQLLRKDDYLPYEKEDREPALCDHCEFVRSEDHSGDCKCEELFGRSTALAYAEELGCEDLPDINDEFQDDW